MTFKFGIEKTITFNADDFISINKEGEYLHRVLAGGNAIESVFYPTLIFDEDEQALKQIWKVIKKDGINGSKILEWLTKTDLAIRKSNLNPLENKNVRSQFTPSKKWIYLVIDRTNPDLAVRIAQYPFSVAKRLNELQSKLNTEDPTKLRYGPTFVWDAIITHKYDANKKGAEWQKHSYDVDVDPNSKFNGQFPAVILDTRRYPNPIECLKEESRNKIFKEEEWNAMNDFNLNMEDILKPNTEEEIMDQLTGKFPIYLNGTRDNVSVFPNPDTFLSEMEKSGYKALASTLENPQLPETLLEKENTEDEIVLDESKKVEEAIVIEESTKKDKIEINSPKVDKKGANEDEKDNSVLAHIQNEMKKSKQKKTDSKVVEKEEKTESKKKEKVEAESKNGNDDKLKLELNL